MGSDARQFFKDFSQSIQKLSKESPDTVKVFKLESMDIE
jgi:hypothetical protein